MKLKSTHVFIIIGFAVALVAVWWSLDGVQRRPDRSVGGPSTEHPGPAAINGTSGPTSRDGSVTSKRMPPIRTFTDLLNPASFPAGMQADHRQMLEQAILLCGTRPSDSIVETVRTREAARRSGEYARDWTRRFCVEGALLEAMKLQESTIRVVRQPEDELLEKAQQQLLETAGRPMRDAETSASLVDVLANTGSPMQFRRAAVLLASVDSALRGTDPWKSASRDGLALEVEYAAELAVCKVYGHCEPDGFRELALCYPHDCHPLTGYLQRLSRHLTPAQRAEARRMAERWVKLRKH